MLALSLLVALGARLTGGTTGGAVAAAPVPLPAGCTGLALPWPARTPLAAIVAGIAPGDALVAIWRYDPARRKFVGFAPRAGAPGDYAATRARGERVMVCMKAAGVLNRPSAAALRGTPPPPPTLSARFPLLPPGAVLPRGGECAARVRRAAWEPRPENTAANHTTGTAVSTISGAGVQANTRFAPRIAGDFTGTTDEIIQWAACKWGMDEDIVRAMAMQESTWRQTAVGPKGTVGLLQIKPTAHPGTYPASQTSTAFNLDYGLAWWRTCYEGYVSWIPASARGDAWGCVGLWLSGRWRDTAAAAYIARIKRHLAEQPWRKPSF